MRIRMRRLAAHELPAGSGHPFSEMWKRETTDLSELEGIVNRWRYNRRSDDLFRAPGTLTSSSD
jgi:hypothetical protein